MANFFLADVGMPQPLRRLPRAFFADEAPLVAQALLGCVLIHDLPDGRRAGRIVETEAYDQADPASHSCRGPTPRTAVMFGPAGYAYVYRSYGLHWCLNVSTGPVGQGAAVLFRALQPIAGSQSMALARAGAAGREVEAQRLCRGPGNLTQALEITGAHNKVDLTQGTLAIYDGRLTPTEQIAAGPRIGISHAQTVPWRFYIAHCAYVSGRRGHPCPAPRQFTTASRQA